MKSEIDALLLPCFDKRGCVVTKKKYKLSNIFRAVKRVTGGLYRANTRLHSQDANKCNLWKNDESTTKNNHECL